jgi:hypothetical protein
MWRLNDPAVTVKYPQLELRQKSYYTIPKSIYLYACKVTLEVEKGRQRCGGYGERGNFGRILG